MIDFPAYSVALYRQSGTEKSCLRLQDGYGLAVNLVLFCYWFGTHHGIVGTELWQRINTISRQWQDQVVRPLREARRSLGKPDFRLNPDQAAQPGRDPSGQQLREQVKQAELAAELAQQRLMQQACAMVADSATVTDPGVALANARGNIDSLLQRRGLILHGEIKELFASIDFHFLSISDAVFDA